jgi:hypothetical protein
VIRRWWQAEHDCAICDRRLSVRLAKNRYRYFFCLGQERQGNRGPPAAVSHLPH